MEKYRLLRPCSHDAGFISFWIKRLSDTKFSPVQTQIHFRFLFTRLRSALRPQQANNNNAY